MRLVWEENLYEFFIVRIECSDLGLPPQIFTKLLKLSICITFVSPNKYENFDRSELYPDNVSINRETFIRKRHHNNFLL